MCIYVPNTVLNTTVYNFEFPNDEISKYSANFIAENTYAQVKDEGYHYQIIDTIITYKQGIRLVHSDSL